MKKIRLLAFVATLVCFGNCLCGADPIGPKPDELATVQGFQLSIVASSPQFQPGKPIDIDSSIKNMAPQAQPLGHIPDLKRYRIQVTTDRGEKIPLTRYGQNQYDILHPSSTQGPCEIEPGGSFKGLLELSRIYDLSESGTYVVKVDFILGLSPDKDPTKANAADYIIIPSNVLRITVL